MSGFVLLGLSPALVRAADQLGYAEPTPIQVAAIPVALKGRDLLGTRATGGNWMRARRNSWSALSAAAGAMSGSRDLA